MRYLTREIDNISDKNAKIIKNNKYQELFDKIDMPAWDSSLPSEKQSFESLQREVGGYQTAIRLASSMVKKLEALQD